MNAWQELKEKLAEVEDRLGYTFENRDFLILSLIHRSFVNEFKQGELQHNERLEFLGDSVLGLIVADYLYERLPNHPEGMLSQLRSRLVDASSCAQYMQKLGISSYILLGRGEKITEGQTKISIQSDVFEAVIGAIYLDGGIGVAKSFFLSYFEEEINQAIGNPPRNFKADLQDYSQKKFQKTPVYKVIQESGPDHSKVFHIMVFINDKQAGSGIGASKKEAEQKAALDALTKIGEVAGE